MTKNLESVNIRMPSEIHDKMKALISDDKLKTNINAFANESIKACIEMMEEGEMDGEITLPEFIDVARYILNRKRKTIKL